jgi:hypothetical protein
MKNSTDLDSSYRQNLFSRIKNNYPNTLPEPLPKLPVSYSMIFFNDIYELTPITNMTLIKVPLSSAIINTLLTLLEIKKNNPDRTDFVIKRRNINYQVSVSKKEVIILSNYVVKLITENQRLLKNQRQVMEDEEVRLEMINDALLGN